MDARNGGRACPSLVNKGAICNKHKVLTPTRETGNSGPVQCACYLVGKAVVICG